MLYDILRVGIDIRYLFNQKIKQFDLTYQQWQILKLLNSSPKGYLASTEIVHYLNSDKATVSEIIKKLEKKGMIKIIQDEEDKRKKNIFISKSMKEKCYDLKKIEADYWETLVEGFTDEDLKNMEVLLDKFTRSINESKKSL